MPTYALIGLSPLLLALPVGSALAQSPAAPPPAASDMAAPGEPAAVTAPAPGWSLDLLVGLPTGLRVQARLGESAWVAEGFVGLYIIVPMAGGGVRRCFTPLSGERDALCLSPGVDVYLLMDPFNNKYYYGGGAADVDIFWRHTYGPCLQSDLGIKVGVGGVVGGHGGAAVPILSLFGGLRF